MCGIKYYPNLYSHPGIFLGTFSSGGQSMVGGGHARGALCSEVRPLEWRDHMVGTLWLVLHGWVDLIYSHDTLGHSKFYRERETE